MNGTYTFNENIFADVDFIESAVTDRPLPPTEEVPSSSVNDTSLIVTATDESLSEVQLVSPGTSHSNKLNQNSAFSIAISEALHGYPKAAARKLQGKQTLKQK